MRSADLAASDPDGEGLQRLSVPDRPGSARPNCGPPRGRVGALDSLRTVGGGVDWRNVGWTDGSTGRGDRNGRAGGCAVWLEPFLSGRRDPFDDGLLQPVSTHQVVDALADLVKLDSDAVTKEEKRRIDARHRRATQRRPRELVAGFPEMGYLGLVTVSAKTIDELEKHSEIVEQLARESGIDLRSLDARHDLGWAAALPLGLAPSTLLAS